MSYDHHDFDPRISPAVPCAETNPAAMGQPCRTPSGKFTGAGSVTLETAPEWPAFSSKEQASEALERQLAKALAVLVAQGNAGGEAPPPAVVIKASPGAGKSRKARVLLSQEIGLGGDVVWHAPTLDLVDEAAGHAQELGAEAHTFRGRSAKNPNTGEPMCAKHELADRVARLGFPVQPSLCRLETKDRPPVSCEFYATCPYQQQRHVSSEGEIQRYMTTRFLTLPDPTERQVALRVVDETFWSGLTRRSAFTVESFIAPRTFYPHLRKGGRKAAEVEGHADLLAAAHRVVQLLTEGGSLVDLPYFFDELREFGDLELNGLPPAPEIRPDQNPEQQSQAIAAAESLRRAAFRFRRFWLLIAEAKRQGRTRSERILLQEREDRVRMIRMFEKEELPTDAPMLLLDADADPTIIEAFVPGAAIESVALRPRAHVIQVEDRRMSNTALLNARGLRTTWCDIIRREVLFDRFGANGGVLVGATRKVVKRFFEDSGHSFSNMTEAEISAFMLGTALHGANWTWFGGRSLGSNRYRDCSSVIVIGREEPSVDGVEEAARSVFGDAEGLDLEFVQPDEEGRRLLPEDIVPYFMADGSARGARVRMHPDRRVRAIQAQIRENATRQLIERLRLAHASYEKRVILGCDIPIPDLPVDQLVSWEDLTPARFEAACAEAFMSKGAIRVSAAGLHADAPEAFPTSSRGKPFSAGKSFLKRNPQVRDWTPSAPWPEAVRVCLRLSTPGARTVDALVLGRSPSEAFEVAKKAYGSLKGFCVTKN